MKFKPKYKTYNSTNLHKSNFHFINKHKYCYRCELTFDKKYLRFFMDEDILTNEELGERIEVVRQKAKDEEDDEE